MKSKRLFQILVLLALLFTSIGTNQPVLANTSINLQAQPFVSMMVLPASIAVNETVTATVSLNNIPTEGYTSAEFSCTYPANLVEVRNIVVTGLFGPDPATAISDPQNGSFIVGMAGSQGNKATAGGVAFTFQVKGLGIGQVALDCAARVSDGGNLLTGIGSATAGLMVMEATATPTIAPAACDKAEFIADINVPPGTFMPTGAQFTKTWRLKNIGSCVWTASYRIAFLSGEQMDAVSSVQFPRDVVPGQTVDLSLNMTAPTTPGTYCGYWIFQNDTGKPFGIGPQGNQPWFVDILVSDATLTPTPTATQTPSITLTPTQSPAPTLTQSPVPSPTGPTPTPPAGTVYDFAVNVCTATWSSDAGQLPCPGTEGDPRGFVFKVNDPRLETGEIYTRPGILTFPQDAQNGSIQGLFPPIKVQDGDRFRSILSCEGGATNCYVTFRLGYQIGTNPIETLWGYIEKYDGAYYSMDYDLSRLAGQEVRFALIVDSIGSKADDRALWVGPIIYRPDATATPSVTSTPLESPTATSLPASGMLTGQIHAGKPVTISVYRDNAILVASQPANSDGTFSFTTPVGTYLIVAKADGFLGAQGSITVTAGNTSAMPVISLPAGDIDNNNRIDQFDALTIGMNYNTALPTIADLNNDGIINVLDLELLAGNYRKAGLVPWNDYF
ncbi:MAG: hypothetical protein EHM33_05345 [Chloroflexi bacterium]|nr:MAG: hypothetical protein EHM33_05345 [Chloroflexota bacterium]